MAFSGFMIALATTSGKVDAQSSTKAARTVVQPLTCGGCGAPLSAPGAACSYCQRAGTGGDW